MKKIESHDYHKRSRKTSSHSQSIHDCYSQKTNYAFSKYYFYFFFLVSIIFNGELFNTFPQFRNELWIPTISLLFSILWEVLASLKDKK